MARRFISLTAVVALTLGTGVVAATAAGAKAPPSDAHGSLHCVISGKVKIAPTPLTFNGPATATTFTAKVKSASCTGSSGVTSFKGNLVARLPSSNCNDLAALPFPASNIDGAKVKGSAKHTASNIHFSGGAAFTPADPITMDQPGAGTSTVTGSFAGQPPTMHLVFDQTVAIFAANCQPKTKGVKGSGGLKKMSFNTSSFIDIPA